MNNKVQEFRNLHQKGNPVIIANVWDVISTKAAEKAGYKVIGASSHPIADTLGYKDGQNMSFEEAFFITNRIAKSTELYVSLDMESGYTEDLEKLNQYVEKLVDAGVIAINLEDGLTNGEDRKLGSIEILANKIKSIKEYLNSKNKDIFINARIDTYTTKHSNAFDETLNRAQEYKAAGADGIFVPLITDKHEIKTLLETVEIPLNIFLTPDFNDYDTIKELGIQRISSGNKAQAVIVKEIENVFHELNENKNFKILF